MSLENRYEFVLLFDVKDGNPNGDPDAGNLPRTDAETGNGLVSDVCLKRKVRNFVTLTQNEKPGYDIYVAEKAILTNQQKKAYDAKSLDDKDGDKADNVKKAQAWMCKTFFDIRTFGAVMSLKEYNCGQVRGPVQMTFARSVDPVVSSEHAITRMAVATEKEAKDQSGDNRTMGRKFTVPYGLYRENGFVNPFFADQTGFGEDDLKLLWDTLKNMFDLDRSAARGLMASRKLIIFKHKDKLGNAPASVLFDAVKIEKNPGVEVPRDFSDYTVTIDESKIPEGVEVIEML
ncbi:MAG: type I-C CRISPR-associated protein Cas7/Csd2 [Opitutales bacterium]|nr:type I-C CRISPR-associated protein Cas7/Csd2 [Opitutales bacterium]